eukprot:TRINITY_DN60332_c0_g1_i1.p1 TRINITY_DN60332_c0_g1~~TRINITY_DN60332_c0_g1_i1.p1  ORF type:complete len:716 (+),score=41.77 TRINITY_DN60332_c0_g1_i1:64-2211(+)
MPGSPAANEPTVNDATVPLDYNVEDTMEFQFRNPLRGDLDKSERQPLGGSVPLSPSVPLATSGPIGPIGPSKEVASKAESRHYYRRKNTMYEKKQTPFISRPLHYVVDQGLDDRDDYEIRRSKSIVLTFILPATFFLWVWFCYTLINYNTQFPHVLDAWLILVTASCLTLGIVYYLTKKDHTPVRNLAAAFATLYPLAFWFSHGCIDLPVSAHLWGFCAPIGLLLTGASSRRSLYVLILSLVITLCILTVDTFDLAHCPAEWASAIEDRRVSWFLLRLVLDIVPLILIYMALQEFRRRMYQEKILSHKLLKNVLPPDIADVLEERLRTEELGASISKRLSPTTADLVIADHYLNVPVMFADLVGFTAYSKTVSPHQLVKHLNTIVELLDDTCTSVGVMKIKTIGDCYMCAGFPPSTMGVSTPQGARTSNAADMVLATMQVAVKAVTIGGTDTTAGLEFRVGLHMGPVVAGVIGATKFIYDLWGDTVNVASRLESHGRPSHVQVTEPVYKILKSKYAFSFRGAVALKNFGEVVTWVWSPEHELPQTANTLVSRADSVLGEVETMTLPSSKNSKTDPTELSPAPPQNVGKQRPLLIPSELGPGGTTVVPGGSGNGAVGTDSMSTLMSPVPIPHRVASEPVLLNGDSPPAAAAPLGSIDEYFTQTELSKGDDNGETGSAGSPPAKKPNIDTPLVGAGEASAEFSTPPGSMFDNDIMKK